MTVLAVTDATFEREVLAAELPVLIDLYADWCQPCKQLAPVVAGIAAEFAGVIKVVKIDIEASPGVAQMFRVQSIPMLVVMQGGRPVAAEQGVLDRAQLLEMLAPFLPQSATELKPADLAQLLAQKQALPVDIRDERSFGRFHIPGAINVPAEDAASRAAEFLPSDGRLRVLYSRTDEDAKRLADELGKQGVEVGYLAGGFLHWEADGLEVERRVKLSDIGDPRQGDPAAPLLDLPALLSLGAPTLVVFGVRRGDLAPQRFAQLLVRESVARSLPVVVYSLRRGAGPFEPDTDARGQTFLDDGAQAYRGGRVAADPDAIDAQLRSWSGLDKGTLRIALGTDFAARARAQAVVALTAGLPLVAFSPAARSVVTRVGLQLTEPRAMVARGLVERLSAALPSG